MSGSKELEQKIQEAMSELANVKSDTGGKGKMLNYVTVGKDEMADGDVIPFQSGHLSLDLSIGIGGIPKGKIIEFNGGEGSFKSAISWSIVGKVQRSGGLCAWLDAENAVDFRIPKFRKFISLLGVDIEHVLILRPETAEQGFKMVQALAKSGTVDLIVWDSIVALSNEREDTADMEKTDRNTLPATINKGLRKTAGHLRKSDCTLILINQLRQNMDAKGPYDKKWQTTGGKGLKHWLSLQMSWYSRKIKDSNKRVIGYEIHGNIEKTRFDNIRDEAVMYFYVNQGFDTFEEVLRMAQSYEVISKSGNSYIWNSHEKQYGKMSLANLKGLFTGTYDYDSMTVSDLKDLCEERGLEWNKKMKKDELIELLESEEADVSDNALFNELAKEVIEAYEAYYNPDDVEHDLDDLSDDDDDEDDEDDDYDFDSMSVKELKELCDEWELDYPEKAKKPELIEILEEYYYDEEDEDE